MAAETDLPCPWWSEALLRREYIHRGRTKTEIAERWGCSTDTITHWLEKHGIAEVSA